jgi:hypothetical protein
MPNEGNPEILPGTQLMLGTENDGEYSFTVIQHEAP